MSGPELWVIRYLVPFLIDGNLTLLEEAITPGIVSAIENNAFDCDPILQQDRAPPHAYVP